MKLSEATKEQRQVFMSKFIMYSCGVPIDPDDDDYWPFSEQEEEWFKEVLFEDRTKAAIEKATETAKMLAENQERRILAAIAS